MSVYSFRPAKRSEAKPLIGIYSESGCGKTWSALLLARGFVGPEGRIGMIETESGRGEAYADILPGGYDVLSIRETFSPTVYGDALTAAEKAELGALIIDSASHEWEGSGGVLAIAAANQAAGKKGPLIWQDAKLDHQRYFMLRLMATPIPLVIVNMRAKYPMEETIVDGKKEWSKSKELAPKQSEDILYELFVHGWIDKAHQFHGTKYTRPDLRDVIRDGEAITLETGQRLAAWAKGGAVATHPAESSDRPPSRLALITEIDTAILGWPKQPDDETWAAICLDVCGTCDLENADVSVLSDLLTVARTYPDPKSPARHRVNGIARKLKGQPAA